MSAKLEMPEATTLAIRHLLQVAASEGVMVAGFAFKSDPMAVTSFGNCSDHNDIKIYQTLCTLVETQEARGMVIKDFVEKPV